MKQLVSVVIPIYKNVNFLKDSLGSVINQDIKKKGARDGEKRERSGNQGCIYVCTKGEKKLFTRVNGNH